MARFDVYISGDGLAEIDGHTLVPEPGQSVHEAVLDRLEGNAREQDDAVLATVYDGPGAARFLLEVLPDGSSRVLEPGEDTPSAPGPSAPGPGEGTVAQPGPAASEPGEDTVTGPGLLTPEPGEGTVAEPGAGAPGPGGGDVPATVVVPAPSAAGASAVATAVARARATAAALAEVPDPAAVAAPAVTTVLPADLTERIGRVNALAADGRLDEAFADASALRESLTGSMGAEHPYAVEARAVEAYLAHLRGDHREAIVLALAVARIRCGARDGRAPAEVARAAAAWQQLDDDRAVVAHGRELLHMWAMLDRNGLLPPGYAALVGQVRGQVDALEAYV
ncbi:MULTISPECIES: tetratricopeptide repeat protein [unclassified Streptomyces]|uniref:tetratricopeptide repeat protein n=1 Tax=unclassified Streptomyces TaxID=2593676 RepID=UPI0033B63E98